MLPFNSILSSKHFLTFFTLLLLVEQIFDNAGLHYTFFQVSFELLLLFYSIEILSPFFTGFYFFLYLLIGLLAYFNCKPLIYHIYTKSYVPNVFISLFLI